MKVIVHIQGQGPVTLTQREYVASGGEGSVYAKGATAYKIYADPSRMLPLGKITELATITNRAVIRPELVLLDSKLHSPVGYTMRFVPNTMPLCQVLTRAFREREGLDHAKMLKLVQALRALVADVHKAGILIVDLNELNFLVDKAFSEVFGIDVDSYQTAHYPATAIMPSIRDWTVQGHAFTEGSDWFSFACVAYQMFTGIHPFKGKHPTVHGLEDRMKAGISVFDPAVSVPKVVYPSTVIPPAYLAWFKAVLQDGQRIPPPTDPTAFVAMVITRAILSGTVLDVVEVASFAANILGYVEVAGHVVVGTRAGVWYDGRLVLGTSSVRAVGASPKSGHVVVAWVEGDTLRLFDVTSRRDVPTVLRVDEVMGYDGRIYVKVGDQVLEMLLNESGQNVVATAEARTSVVPLATKMIGGVVMQHILGSTFVSVYPQAGVGYQARVPELNPYKVLDARFDSQVLMVVGAMTGRYDRLTFLFDPTLSTFTLLSTVKDVTPSGINFVVLDNGTCVHITEEEKIEVWSVRVLSKLRVVDDKTIGGDMRLIKLGGRVGFIRDDKIYSVRIR